MNTLRFRVVVSSLVLLLLMGTIIFHHLEDWSYIKSFYFSVVTLTTVGYGDLYPTTDGGRLVTAFYILFGVAIAISALTIVGDSYLRRRHSSISRRRKK